MLLENVKTGTQLKKYMAEAYGVTVVPRKTYARDLPKKYKRKKEAAILIEPTGGHQFTQKFVQKSLKHDICLKEFCDQGKVRLFVSQWQKLLSKESPFTKGNDNSKKEEKCKPKYTTFLDVVRYIDSNYRIENTYNKNGECAYDLAYKSFKIEQVDEKDIERSVEPGEVSFPEFKELFIRTEWNRRKDKLWHYYRGQIICESPAGDLNLVELRKCYNKIVEEYQKKTKKNKLKGGLADKPTKAPTEIPTPENTRIYKGKKLVTIPDWAKAVIVADMYENQSDSMTDYFHASEDIEQRQFLAFSKTTRNNMAELRKAAERFEHTKNFGKGYGIFRPIVVANEDIRGEGALNLYEGQISPYHDELFQDKEGKKVVFTTKEEAENWTKAKGEPHSINFKGLEGTFKWKIKEDNIEVTSSHSTLPGYYLGTESWDGWKVHKLKWFPLDKEENRDQIYIAAAEGRYFAGDKPTKAPITKPSQPTTKKPPPRAKPIPPHNIGDYGYYKETDGTTYWATITKIGQYYPEQNSFGYFIDNDDKTHDRKSIDSRAFTKQEKPSTTQPSNPIPLLKKKLEENPEQIHHTIEDFWTTTLTKEPHLLKDFIQLQKDLKLTVKQRIDPWMVVPEYENENKTFFTNLKEPLWKLIPQSYKNISIPKQVVFSPRPDDKNLATITDMFTGKDQLRTSLMGTYFDIDNSRIVATDAHRMIIIDEKPVGIDSNKICLTGKSAIDAQKGKLTDFQTDKDCYLIDEKYPDYERVVPQDYVEATTFNATKLYKFCQVIIKSRFVDPTTKAILLKTKNTGKEDTDKQFEFGFNAQFISDMCKAFLLMGITELDMVYNELLEHKAFLFVPKGHSRKISGFNTDLVLIMPMSKHAYGGEHLNRKGTWIYDLHTQCAESVGLKKLGCIDVDSNQAVDTTKQMSEYLKSSSAIKKVLPQPKFKKGARVEITHYSKEVDRAGTVLQSIVDQEGNITVEIELVNGKKVQAAETFVKPIDKLPKSLAQLAKEEADRKADEKARTEEKRKAALAKAEAEKKAKEKAEKEQMRYREKERARRLRLLKLKLNKK